MVNRFNVGDRVKAISAVGSSDLKDVFGTIIEVHGLNYFLPYLVEFDEDIKGHNGNGIGKVSGKAGHCWWCGAEEIESAPYRKFKVGDVVIGNDKANEHYSMTRKGWIGKVVKVRDNGEIDAKAEGDRYEFKNLDPECFNLYNNDQPTKIVITTDGKTTTAKLYRGEKLIDTKTAKCSPEDTFDFKVGARIAFDRLVGTPTGTCVEEPTYYNGKVICTDKGVCNCYTPGKIYQFKDGMFTDDNGLTHGNGIGDTGPYKTFRDWQDYSSAKWLEVVE